MSETNLIAIAAVEELDLNVVIHELDDRGLNVGSAREHTSVARWLFDSGSSVRSIASVLGKSYEWTRRIVKNVAYDYAENDAVLS
jgi:hypothetical protein